MAERGLVKVALSVTTLDRKLARAMEPRASTPDKRLETVQRLVDAGVPASVMVAPVIPGLTDMEMERILERAASLPASRTRAMCCSDCRSRSAISSPNGCKANCPDRAKRVLSLMRSTRGGKLYDAKWGERMTGDGPYAWMIGRQISNSPPSGSGSTKARSSCAPTCSRPPSLPGQQLRLF